MTGAYFQSDGQYPSKMHMVNCALMRCLAECKTWAAVEQWADCALQVYRQADSLRDEVREFHSTAGAQSHG